MYVNGIKIRPEDLPGNKATASKAAQVAPVEGSTHSQVEQSLAYEFAAQDQAIAQSKLILGLTFEIPAGLQGAVLKMTSSLRSGEQVGEDQKQEFTQLLGTLVDHQVERCVRDLMKLRGQDFPGYTRLERDAFKEILQWAAMTAFRDARNRESLLKNLLGQ